MSRKIKLAEKYTELAQGFTENSYSNPEELMRRRAELIVSWGKLLQTGDSVLELGCGDGSLAHRLVREGLRYTGTDLWMDSSGEVGAALVTLGEIAGARYNKARLATSYVWGRGYDGASIKLDFLF